MGPVTVSILQKETGARIRELMEQNGYSVQDIQKAMGFQNPQAIYKWMGGQTLPSIDNMVILSRLLHTTVDDLLVLAPDGVVFSEPAQPEKKSMEKAEVPEAETEPCLGYRFRTSRDMSHTEFRLREYYRRCIDEWEAIYVS